MASTLLPPMSREMCMESRQWDKQYPITTTLFCGTVLHAPAQKPFDHVSGRLIYLQRTHLWPRRASSRTGVSTYKGVLGCPADQIGISA